MSAISEVYWNHDNIDSLQWPSFVLILDDEVALTPWAILVLLSTASCISQLKLPEIRDRKAGIFIRVSNIAGNVHCWVSNVRKITDVISLDFEGEILGLSSANTRQGHNRPLFYCSRGRSALKSNSKRQNGANLWSGLTAAKKT